MRRAMLAMFAVNKSGSVKQCVISLACCEPIFFTTDKQSDRDIFDSRRDEQQIVCINSCFERRSETDPCGRMLEVKYVFTVFFNSAMCSLKLCCAEKEKCL